jgi:hypothetical protein
LSEFIDLIKKTNIDSDRILIKSTKKLNKLNDLRTIPGIKVEYDTHDLNYYQWNYGMEGIKGEGLTIAVFNKAIQRYLDVGNLVRIIEDSEKEICIEFGFGYEYFLSALIEEKEPLKFSKVFEVFNHQTGVYAKYYSYLEAAMQMRLAGTKIGNHKADFIYKKYIKALQFIGTKIEKSSTEIIEDMEKYCLHINGQIIDLEKEKKFIQKHIKAKKDFIGILKRVCCYLYDKEKSITPKEHINDPEKFIRKYLFEHGINYHEISALLNKLKRFNLQI